MKLTDLTCLCFITLGCFYHDDHGRFGHRCCDCRTAHDIGDSAREEILGGGTKIVKVPTASEASKIFGDHTFLIGSKFDKILQKHDEQVTKVPTVHSNFQKFKCRRGTC